MMRFSLKKASCIRFSSCCSTIKFWLKIRNRLFRKGKRKIFAGYENKLFDLYSINRLLYLLFLNIIIVTLVLTRQTFGQMQRLKESGVHTVLLTSFESDNQPTEGFSGSQSVNNNYTQLNTSLASAVGGTSLLISYFNTAGLLVKTVDTTDGATSVTEYFYNAKNQVERIVNNATSKGQATEKEEHLVIYGSDGKPVKMFRVKNNNDTTYVSFVTDESGNIAEENSIRKGIKLPSFFYYYNEENKLTDIATYNIKAKRLLPVYVFDYNEMG